MRARTARPYNPQINFSCPFVLFVVEKGNRKMKCIVCVSENWGIGKDGKMLFHLPADLEFFKQQTLNKVVVMGRPTYQSLPNGALKNRTNIVLTKSDFSAKDAITLNSITKLFDFIKEYNTDDIFIIGGEKVYTQMLKHCKAAIVTKVFSRASADTFFPNLDLMDNWDVLTASPVFEQNGLKYSFIEYINKGDC